MGLQLLMFAVSALVQMAQARAQKKREKKMREEAARRADAAKGFIVATEGEAAPLPLCYGRNLVGGVRVYHNTASSFTYAGIGPNGKEFANALNGSASGKKHEFLFVQTAICRSGINDILHVEVDGRPYSDAKFRTVGDQNPDTTDDGGRGGLIIHAYTNGGTPDAMMTANDGNRATAYFSNCAFATGVYRLNRDDYNFSGVPDVRFYIEGMKVSKILGTDGAFYLSSEKVYSNNPVLCLLDYLTNTEYGRGLKESALDLDSFYYAYLICERVVLSNLPKDGSFWANKTGSRDIKLYECNITIDTTASIRDNIESILETMGLAELIWSAGRYKLSLIYPEVYNPTKAYSKFDIVEYTDGNGVEFYRSSINNNLNNPTTLTGWIKDVTVPITDNDILRSGENTISWPNASDRYNFARIKFLNESQDFKEDQVGWPPKTGTVDGPAIDRGEWSFAETYTKSDIVTYNSVKYQLQNSRFIHRGSYSSAVHYYINDTVFSGSTAYVCKQECTGVSLSDTNYWGAAGSNGSSYTPDVDNGWIIYQENLVYNQFRKEDNGLPLELDFFEAGTTDYYHALAKAEQRVRTSRSSTLYKFSLTLNHSNLEPGDLIKVTSSVLGIPGEVMRIEDIKITENREVQIEAYKFDSRTLAWNVADNEVVPPRNLYSDFFLDQVTNLAFTPISNLTLSVGKLTWTAPNDNRVNLYIIKRTLTPAASITTETLWEEVGRTSATYFDLPSLQGNTYVFTVVSANANGRLAPRDNGLGSKWPLLTIDINPIVLSDTSIASVSVFKRSINQPLAPTGGIFDFDLLAMSTLPNGWTTVIPEGKDKVWVSQSRAEGQMGTGTDNTLSWSTPTMYLPPVLDYKLTDPIASVLYSYAGNDYSNAFGYFKVTEGTVDISTIADISYSVYATDSCSVTINDTTDKGRYTVTNLIGDIGTAVLRATYRGATYDVILNIVKLNIDYIKDITPPPAPDQVSIVTGLSTVFIQLISNPTYTEGHGHDVTRVYGAVWDGISALPTINTASVIKEFKGSHDTLAYGVGAKLRLWFKWVSKDGVESNTYFGGLNGVDAELGLIGNTHLGPLVVEANNLAADSVNATHLAPNSIAVGTAAIQTGAITNAMIQNLTADKILTGEINVAEQIKLGGHTVVSGEGWIENYSQGNYSKLGDYSRMDAGQFTLYRYVPSLGQTFAYAYVRRYEAGVANNGTTVTLPGYWKSQPKILVSPYNLSFYKAAYANQDQSVNCQAIDLVETSPGSMVWTFRPVATLNLAASISNSVYNLTSTAITTNTYSSTPVKTTPANTSSFQVNLRLTSIRGNGASQYLYRKVDWRIAYRPAGSTGPYSYSSYQTKSIGASLASVLDSRNFVFTTANSYEWYIEYIAADESTNVFGAASYEYSTETVKLLGDTSTYNVAGNHVYTPPNKYFDYDLNPGYYTLTASNTLIDLTFKLTASTSTTWDVDWEINKTDVYAPVWNNATLPSGLTQKLLSTYVAQADTYNVFPSRSRIYGSAGSATYELNWPATLLDSLVVGYAFRIASGSTNAFTTLLQPSTINTSWEIYQIDYSWAIRAGYYNPGGVGSLHMQVRGVSRGSAASSGSTHISAASWSQQSFSETGTNLTYSRTALSLVTTGNTGLYWTVGQVKNALAVIKRRRPLTSSSTPSNTFEILDATYTLATAQVLATGSLNWMAIGD